MRRWQVAASLIYGQVKKSYRRRKLTRVTPVLRLGTEAALKAPLEHAGFSGRLNTAFIERVNLTVRHGVAALARRTWATAQQSPHLLAQLEWWRAYYHFVRPHLDLLTRLWSAEAQTLPELTTDLRHSQHPEDILQGVTVLSEAGYVLVEGERMTLTDYGQQVRTRIEEETDRIYFTA